MQQVVRVALALFLVAFCHVSNAQTGSDCESVLNSAQDPEAIESLQKWLPEFTGVSVQEARDYIEAEIVAKRQLVDSIVSTDEPASFENTILALMKEDRKEIDAVGLLHLYSNFFDSSVYDLNDPELQKSFIEHDAVIFQNEKLYERVVAIYRKRDSIGLSEEERRLVERVYGYFKDYGTQLSQAERDAKEQLELQISELTRQYLHKTQLVRQTEGLYVAATEDITGILPQFLAQAKAAAEKRGYESGWFFNTADGSLFRAMAYAESEQLRKRLYQASMYRHEKGETDKRAIAAQIMNLRMQVAQLLGYRSHADFVLEDRMAKRPERVKELLTGLLTQALPLVKQQAVELDTWAKTNGLPSARNEWNLAYIDRLKSQEGLGFDPEQLRGYFPLDHVFEGLKSHLLKLLGLEIREIEASTWHPEVRVLQVYSKDQKLLGTIYWDPLKREEKNPVAFHSSKRGSGEFEIDGVLVRLPSLIILSTNFRRPTEEGQPVLLGLESIQTLFHEFGHALHTLLSETRFVSLSGTRVATDFVELPSQLLEKWLEDDQFLRSLSKHYETDEEIPWPWLMAIRKKQIKDNIMHSFGSARLALLDLEAHSIRSPLPVKQLGGFERRVIKPWLFRDRSLSSYELKLTDFSHIFLTGYDAAYYSYIWSDVMVAQAFELFEQRGLYNPEVAEALRKMLAYGGAKDELDNFIEFRGQEPSPEAYMKPFLRAKADKED